MCHAAAPFAKVTPNNTRLAFLKPQSWLTVISPLHLQLPVPWPPAMQIYWTEHMSPWLLLLSVSLSALTSDAAGYVNVTLYRWLNPLSECSVMSGLLARQPASFHNSHWYCSKPEYWDFEGLIHVFFVCPSLISDQLFISSLDLRGVHINHIQYCVYTDCRAQCPSDLIGCSPNIQYFDKMKLTHMLQINAEQTHMVHFQDLCSV